MATDRTITKFEVSTTENDDGTLLSLNIQRTQRVTRESETGKTLSYGSTVSMGEPMEIPISKVPDLIRELADWPIYYATGQAARDRR
jgi:hypothetical protein